MTPDARTIDFYDRHVSQMISEKYGFDEKKAIRAFLESETYQTVSFILGRPGMIPASPYRFPVPCRVSTYAL